MIKYYSQEVNRGLGEALRIGSEFCTGDYILRMDSDDISDKKRFAKQMAYVEAHPEIDAVGTDIAEFNQDPFTEEMRTRICPVKGQDVALCYEKPQWLTSGDVDLFLSDENYQKAKDLLRPMASIVEPETEFKKHLGLMIDGWLVELHGSLRNGLSSKMDKTLDCIKHETFYSGHVRSGIIGNTQVFMLSIENDIMYVFSHILDHFYKGGIGLRQICDWVRLIWTYRDSLNLGLLKLRIRRMGVMTEWKVFGALAVDWLGMPSEAMPFYSSDAQWSRKAVKVKDFVMEVGNFGHNRDTSYYDTKPFIVKKTFSFWMRVKDVYHHAQMFPLDSIRFFWGITVTGMKAIAKGK